MNTLVDLERLAVDAAAPIPALQALLGIVGDRVDLEPRCLRLSPLGIQRLNVRIVGLNSYRDGCDSNSNSSRACDGVST